VDPRLEWLEQDKAIRKAIAAENATKSVKPRPVPYTGTNSTVIDSSSDPFGDAFETQGGKHRTIVKLIKQSECEEKTVCDEKTASEEKSSRDEKRPL
jgi:hypothetical protein